ncbi:hypothetical protein FNF29_02050 [Cafeteria roenbergensis]|uniref:Archease domain-containing protein n=1 Tax=Cafeteria roenbergensis TaxID=33653 RepID=A0A5A8CQE5_CAFRO|nr:hypothetical protein FNF29_02050 [Cafeteria roenbergensis]|eukprot:KAA0154909.1 hypothetical protein FNF29_02050 [Cafeteria roenbergensis]
MSDEERRDQGEGSGAQGLHRVSLRRELKKEKCKKYPGEARALAAFVLALVQVIDQFVGNGGRPFPCSAAAFDLIVDGQLARTWAARADEAFPALRERDSSFHRRRYTPDNRSGSSSRRKVRHNFWHDFDMVAIVLRREGHTGWVAPEGRAVAKGHDPETPQGALVFELGSLLRSLLTRATARAWTALAPGDRYSGDKAFPELSGDGIDGLLHIMLQFDPCERASAPWSRPACKYEYLDHTADVQLHAWGSTLEEALGQAVVAMTGYMTDVNTVHPGAGGDAVLKVEAGDLLGLVYRLLDEALFRFNGDGMLICDAVVESLAIGGGLPARAVRADESSPPASGTAARLTCRVRGEAFSRDRHPCGTEIKAITYSQMTVQPPLPPGAAERTEAGPATAGPSRPATGGLDDDRPYAEHAKWRPDEWHLFVIVDI